MPIISDRGVVFAPCRVLGSVKGELPPNLECKLHSELLQILNGCYSVGDRVFITYMECWWGVITAEAILEFKRVHPDITFVVFVSHRGEERDYNSIMRKRYYLAISHCDMDISTYNNTSKEYIPDNNIIVELASTIVDFNPSKNIPYKNDLELLAISKRLPYINMFDTLSSYSL